MINKHFFKTLLLFTAMIGLGLFAIFVISYFDKGNEAGVLDITKSTAKVVK